MDLVKKMQLCKGDSQWKGNCQFIGYCANVIDIAEVRAAYIKVKWLHPHTLHIACAYRIAGLNCIQLRGCEDDGEYGAGREIYKLMEDKDVYNKVIFVVPHYGNRHLGPVRFQLITAAARTALMRAGDGLREAFPAAVASWHKKAERHTKPGANAAADRN